MAKAFLGVIALAFSLSFASPALAVTADPAPKWAQLNSEQQTVLAPLANDWDGFTDFRKKKWIGIAKRYPSMRPEEQQNLQRRMRAWSSLTQEQRRRARETFKTIDKLPVEKKLTVRQKWEEYQKLPEAEKRKLAEQGSRPPPAPALRAPRGSGKNTARPAPATSPGSPATSPATAPAAASAAAPASPATAPASAPATTPAATPAAGTPPAPPAPVGK